MSVDVRCLNETARRFSRELESTLRTQGHVVTKTVQAECRRAGRELAKRSLACRADVVAEQNALQALGALLAEKEANLQD